MKIVWLKLSEIVGGVYGDKILAMKTFEKAYNTFLFAIRRTRPWIFDFS